MSRLRLAFLAFLTIWLVQAACNMPESESLPDTGGITYHSTPTSGSLVLPAQPSSTPTSLAQGTPPVSFQIGVISGVVWRDVCFRGDGDLPGPAAPSPGCTPADQGGYHANGFREQNEPGISDVIVSLGAGACPASGLADAATDAEGTYTFAGLASGTYCVSVNLADPKNAEILSSGNWTYPGLAVGSQTITLISGVNRTDVNFGWDSRLQVASGGITASATDACSDQASFVSDVTIPDGTMLSAGVSFVKTWRVRNDGTCVWTPDAYSLTLIGGDLAGNPDQVPVPSDVQPGQTVDLSVNLIAPASPGTYTSQWMFRVEGETPGEETFLGTGPDGTGSLDAHIVVGLPAGAAPSPDPGTHAGLEVPVTGISFNPGTTSSRVEGVLKPGEGQGYALRAGSGHALLASLSSEAKDMRLEIAAEDGQSLQVHTRSDGTLVASPLPSNQRYTVRVIAGQQESSYSLILEIPGLVSLQPGGNSAAVQGSIVDHQSVVYQVAGQAGQELTATLNSPDQAVFLSIEGLMDGQPLLSAEAGGVTTWSGFLPETKDYLIRVVPSTDSTSFNLQVVLK